MSRRDNHAARCERCRTHQSLCVCALIPRIETRTKLLLVVHHKEVRKPTNTGALATECLVNSEVLVRGLTPPAPAPVIPATSQLVLLFPAPDAVSLSDLMPSIHADGRPVTLVVPDGNWRQASKVRAREAWLQGARCAILPASMRSPHRLRAEAHAHGLATMEAIARAFGILEGPAVQEALEVPFRAMVERTLWSRRMIAREDVTSGVPEGTFRHTPQ